MRPGTDFMTVMADFDLHPEAILWRAGSPREVKASETGIELLIPFSPFVLSGGLIPLKDAPERLIPLYLERWSDQILRFTTDPGVPKSPMLCDLLSPLERQLSVTEQEDSWVITDQKGTSVACFFKKRERSEGWSDLISSSFDSLRASFFLGEVVSLASCDQFFPEKVESLPLAFLSWEVESREHSSTLFSFEAKPNEHFAGTGERFARMDLAGSTLVLENTDGLGVNSRRCYKNVPFYLSSRGYGLFVHTSCHMRLSLGGISTRAAQGRVEDSRLDLFLIGGDTPERILHGYRSLTGFPPELPLWSYGMWMSRMTYFSADEITEIAGRLRKEAYPCDVIHIDTGWFEKDWVCEWTFSPERFPDPKGFMAELEEQGFRTSLWQTPNIGEGNRLLEEALRQRYLAPAKKGQSTSSSDFSGQDFGGQIDFTNPEAEAWYRQKIANLLQLGAAVIKTDFGEKINMDADYLNLPADRLHNIYCLLYQRAAFQETVRQTGEGIIWARAGWAGAQRYPVHWGGDAAASWDGMAATIRGGLHLGLSGFGYWSHDIPGFHGLPEFMNTPPTKELYMRWTQLGVFTSHMRYHGTNAREMWHFPEIADLIRSWLELRYRLIPYIREQGKLASESGFPLFRAMLFRDHADPLCWHIDDQYYFGEAFLVAPVMSDDGVRDVYLPEGQWVDLWTGEEHSGPTWLKGIRSPLERMPVFCPRGARIPIYPQRVEHTGQMDLEKVCILQIDDAFTGLRL